MSRYSSRDYFTLEFIPFVAPTSEEKEFIKHSPKHFSSTCQILDGKEAREFYENALAIPSTSKSSTFCTSPKRHCKKSTSVETNSYNCKHFLRYAQDGNLEAVQACLISGKELLINQQDMYGWTPLMCATCEGHVNIVKYLLQFGADFNIKNKQGMTAMDIAYSKHYFDILEIFENGGAPSTVQKSVQATEPKEIYCESCKLYYKESKISHERSIAHLFSSKKSDHTTFYHIPENNKGFQMMLKSGWDQNKGLGSNEEGRKFPVKTVLKKDRSCIGRNKETARVTHFNAYDKSAVKRISDPPVKVVREKTLKKWQRAKLERKNRQKEIEFRRQFICDF